jgi:pseudaminic acid cytidylyltransferase
MKCIAIIPARGGSKRIHKKNVKEFLGKPIIAYSIELAINSGLFDEVMVSTDDNEIANLARSYGANVPFLRSSQNSDNLATTASVILEVIERYAQSGKQYEQGCCIYPTAPLLTCKRLKEAYNKLINNKFDSVFPVLRYAYPVWISLNMNGAKVSPNWPEHLNSRSQDLAPTYHDAGQFYWFNVERFKEIKQLFTDNSGSIEVCELEAQDIDNQTDWKLAELKYKLSNDSGIVI